MVIYGDLGAFSGDDKGRVLDALLAQPMSLSRALFNSTRCYPRWLLPKTESQIRRVLCGEDRDPKQEDRVTFLSLVLSVAERLPGLEEAILGIVLRQFLVYPSVREDALDAFVHYQQDSPEGNDELKALLEELRAQGISIASCEGMLRTLYPQALGPAQVWDYFCGCRAATRYGKYHSGGRDLLANQDLPTAELTH